jgi:hypothetical protein
MTTAIPMLLSRKITRPPPQQVRRAPIPRGRITVPILTGWTLARARRKAGQEALGRMHSRTEDRDADTTWAVRQAQYDAAHGFLFQHHAEFAADVTEFLS